MRPCKETEHFWGLVSCDGGVEVFQCERCGETYERYHDVGAGG